ncbi:hypothetical protein Hanom_Chr11g01014181 [Helianthus anomalus]
MGVSQNLFERKIWITNGPLEYHHATNRTTRSYPSPLGIMHMHQFRRKPNKYGKTSLIRIESHLQNTTRL